MFFQPPASAVQISSADPSLFIINDSGQDDLFDGETLTITPSQPFDIFCSGDLYNKQWYRVDKQFSISRLRQETTSPDVYAINTHGNTLTLQFRPFQSTHAGEYECGFTSGGHTLTPISIFLSKLKLHVINIHHFQF